MIPTANTPLLVAAPSPVFVMWLAIGLAAVLFVWALALIAQLGRQRRINADIEEGWQLTRDTCEMELGRCDERIAELELDLARAHDNLDVAAEVSGEHRKSIDAAERSVADAHAEIRTLKARKAGMAEELRQARTVAIAYTDTVENIADITQRYFGARAENGRKAIRAAIEEVTGEPIPPTNARRATDRVPA